MSRKKKIIIAIGVGLLLVVSLSVYSKLTSEDAMSVSKLKAEGPPPTGANMVSVKGDVQEGSIQYDPQKRIVRFALVGGNQTLPVVYRGLLDDDFRPGEEVIVKGMYMNTGILEAQKLSSGRSAFCNVCH